MILDWLFGKEQEDKTDYSGTKSGTYQDLVEETKKPEPIPYNPIESRMRNTKEAEITIEDIEPFKPIFLKPYIDRYTKDKAVYDCISEYKHTVLINTKGQQVEIKNPEPQKEFIDFITDLKFMDTCAGLLAIIPLGETLEETQVKQNAATLFISSARKYKANEQH